MEIGVATTRSAVATIVLFTKLATAAVVRRAHTFGLRTGADVVQQHLFVAPTVVSSATVAPKMGVTTSGNIPIISQSLLLAVCSILILVITGLISLRLRHQSQTKHKTIDDLKKVYKVNRSHLERKYAEWASLIVLILIIAVAFAVVQYGWPSTLIAAFVALWAVWLGYSQFIDVRNENSIDKFYDRLNLTNKKLDEWPSTRAFAGPWYNRDGGQVGQNYTGDEEKDRRMHEAYKITMYVCLELDNLECALVKYDAGYMNSSNVLRCLDTFKQRCGTESEPNLVFCKLARLCVDGKRIRVSEDVDGDRGYTDRTAEAVRRIADRFDKQGERPIVP